MLCRDTASQDAISIITLYELGLEVFGPDGLNLFLFCNMTKELCVEYILDGTQGRVKVTRQQNFCQGLEQMVDCEA